MQSTALKNSQRRPCGIIIELKALFIFEKALSLENRVGFVGLMMISCVLQSEEEEGHNVMFAFRVRISRSSGKAVGSPAA